MALESEGAADERQPELRRLHHITRIDIEPSDAHPKRHPTHGWQVRARRDGTRLSKFFADARHDGKEDALEAAIAFRDRLLDELPDEPQKPRKAWSNTGVVGLSVREKSGRARSKLYVQLNWVDGDRKRKTGSFSVEKWGLRRALWNGCLKLYRERQAAGYPVEEPHIMFARAQEPFQDLIAAEIAAEEAESARVADEPTEAASGDGWTSPGAEMAREEETIRKLEDALFG